MLAIAAPLAAHAVTGPTVLANPIDPSTLLSKFGLIGLAIVLFAETGLLVGFFLPGDTLLLSAGISLAIGTLHDPLWKFLVVAPIAALIGNLVGYWIGYRAGPKVFHRPDSKFFSPDYVVKAERFFERFGSWTIVLARFVPIVRTIASVMAGVGKMRFSLYLLYSLIGGILWTDSMLLIGHQLGKIQFVQDNKQYLDYVIMFVVVLSLLPTLIHYLRNRNKDGVQVGSDVQ
ncbi:membrane-associated protein [Frankineae bacterium MT45]|nr:membrane-associated protein [Frankineae bacterium MT45]